MVMISYFGVLFHGLFTIFEMTVTYTAQVATCRSFGCFWKLLFRWKGSIYKLLWPNMILYFTLYMILSGIYRFALNEHQRIIFEKFSLHCRTYSDLIPVSFVLGFYVAIVVARWWSQYLTIPWPDSLAMYVSCFVISEDDRGRLIRRTIMRYANLSFLITLSMISPSVKKRFPTYDHMVKAGFLKEEEKKIFDSMDQKTSHPKYWMPLVWAGSIVTRARKEGRVKDDFAMKSIVDEISKFRSKCGELLNYDWISVPLVYTQVVTLAVYTYFVASLMGNQYLDPSKGYPNHTIDPVLPIFTFLQFFFYMGWLMVAETLVNPFGEDDDDFEINWLIDRNLQVSYVVVDEMHHDHPELLKDQHWDDVFPTELPYTEATKQFQMQPFLGSTHKVEIPEGKSSFVPLEVLPEKRDSAQKNYNNPSIFSGGKSVGSNLINQLMVPFKSTAAGSNVTSNICFSPNPDNYNSSQNKFTSNKDSIFSFYRKNVFRDDSFNSLGFLQSETGMGHRKLPYHLNQDIINQQTIFESRIDTDLERERDSDSEVETREINVDDPDLSPSSKSRILNLHFNTLIDKSTNTTISSTGSNADVIGGKYLNTSRIRNNNNGTSYMANCCSNKVFNTTC